MNANNRQIFEGISDVGVALGNVSVFRLGRSKSKLSISAVTINIFKRRKLLAEGGEVPHPRGLILIDIGLVSSCDRGTLVQDLIEFLIQCPFHPTPFSGAKS